MDCGLAGLLIISVSHHPSVGLRVCNTTERVVVSHCSGGLVGRLTFSRMSIPLPRWPPGKHRSRESTTAWDMQRGGGAYAIPLTIARTCTKKPCQHASPTAIKKDVLFSNIHLTNLSLKRCTN
jgi:hypothetical protein